MCMHDVIECFGVLAAHIVQAEDRQAQQSLDFSPLLLCTCGLTRELLALSSAPNPAPCLSTHLEERSSGLAACMRVVREVLLLFLCSACPRPVRAHNGGTLPEHADSATDPKLLPMTAMAAADGPMGEPILCMLSRYLMNSMFLVDQFT